jgi:hypothetical protein
MIRSYSLRIECLEDRCVPDAAPTTPVIDVPLIDPNTPAPVQTAPPAIVTPPMIIIPPIAQPIWP